jgi:hypothetical protein
MLMVESHMDLVAKLYDEAVNLKDDNASLKEQIKDLHRLFDGPSGPPSQHEVNEHSAATLLTSAVSSLSEGLLLVLHQTKHLHHQFLQL